MSARFHQGALLAVLSLALGAAGGFWLAQSRTPAAPAPAASTPPEQEQVLYWYDPMYPQQKFDQPGKSPFMDMQLVPRYADSNADSSTLSIDPRTSQNLGMRLAPVARGNLAGSLQAVGNLALNARDIAVVQARSEAFVERTYALAPDDLLEVGAPLADLLLPEWAAAQEEFLALRTAATPELLAAARQRMRLAGMPAALIAEVERSGRAQPLWTVRSPIAGVLQELNVRTGMRLAAGEPLATINGLRSVWLEVAVPEAEASGVRPGQAVEAHLPAFPGDVLAGKVAAILPQANLDSRTLRLRIELDNPDGRLRPGLTAQVRLQRPALQNALLIPGEAVLRTGQRTLVMLAEEQGRFRPVEVRLGQETADRVEVLHGLQEGQQVVASGQFLLDSEASLRGLPVQGAEVASQAAAKPALHEADGRVVELGANEITLSHGPFNSLGMPGMTMRFPLADPALLQGIAAGDSVRVGVRETDAGLVIERLDAREVQP